ncbi:MAG: hypothetical protein CGW95_05180 [Phenylobacterium zucineum]|nr:MAG: hypothetical protein CGW95_05180 [Phenylobacterium zucineum]
MSDAAPQRPENVSALVEAYFAKRHNLVLFLAARTGSHATAEDLVQDLYIKIAAIDPGIETTSPTALLYRIAINLAHDSERSRQRAVARESAWLDNVRTRVGAKTSPTSPAPNRW